MAEHIVISSGVISRYIGESFEDYSTSGNGGAFLVESGGMLYAADTDFSGNKAFAGGAINNTSGGIMKISDGSFTGNSATDGGAIANTFGAMAAITGATFSANRAEDRGGAVINTSGSVLTVTGATFSANHTAKNAGAIHNTSSGMLKISGGSFTGNSAEKNGGAVYNTSDSVLIVTGASFSSNSAEKNGGAVYNTSRGVAAITDASFTGNSALGNGGAILNTSSGMLKISGGGFSANSASGNGGAINNISSGMLNVFGATFTSNSATSKGGAICNNLGGTVKIAGGSFSGNSAAQGGAIDNLLGGTMYVTDADFRNNAVLMDEGGYGGALYNDGEIHISGNNAFSGNKAFAGGAINNTGILYLGGTNVFSNNIATFAGGWTGGGAIYNFGGTVHLSGTADLQTASDTWGNEGLSDFRIATVDWDLTGKNTGMILNYQYYYNAGDFTRQTVTVNASQASGVYVLASGDLSDYCQAETVSSGKYSFVLTGAGEKVEDVAIEVGDKDLLYGRSLYSLSISDNGTAEDKTDDKLLLTVSSTEIEYTLSESVNAMYDGTARSITVTVTKPVEGYTLSYSLNGGTDWTVGNYSMTDAGTASVCFKIEADGYETAYTGSRTITITSRDVVLTSASDSKPYDGTPLTNDTVTVRGSGWVEGEGATYLVTGCQTEIGSSANTFIYELDSGTKTGNYNITKQYGTLTVTEAPAIKATRGDFGEIIGISDILFQNLTDSANPLGAWMDADKWKWNGALGPAPKSDWTVYGAYDFTGDGVCDIMFRSKLASTEYAVGYYDMGEGGTFKTMGWGVTAEWKLADVGDFNGNGVSDILWKNSDNGYLGLWMDGTNQWVALPASALGAGQSIIGMGDVNNDGCDDILINSNGVLGAWDITGIIKGTEGTPIWSSFGITVSSDWATIGCADFDGNGKADIVLWNDNGYIGTYMNCDCNDFRGIYPTASKEEWGIPGFGDYDGDGSEDVLVRNLASGALGYWDGNDNFKWHEIGSGVDSTWAVIA